MTIAILPARLANQIAAGEVVERPASVIKELIENSLDAGATNIHIDVDKGGIKKIKITDNGQGIVKDELTLALSRHATSKIKDLNDLEAINSLGFRGEALASISSVSRLTLTSKPASQETAWQAIAEGRDMSVAIKPAAHPDGTSIEVLDLFFNTPARRKFLRTEKTEFNHIDEVIKRIALAHFDVSFTLTHNGNIVRQYRIANTHAQFTKRVAMVCGPKFIEHAIEVDCPHDSMTLSGWLAKPSFARSQNDLCYSYVNGRMMRDKLINHAIRQAYADLLPADSYPAFVLFLQLDYREVDVNVHPSKHEVRFHQSRYVHDFIYSVCHKALMSELEGEALIADSEADMMLVTEQSYANTNIHTVSENHTLVNDSRADYIKPLQHTDQSRINPNSQPYRPQASQSVSRYVSPVAANNYQTLMTPHAASLPVDDTFVDDTAIPQVSSATDSFLLGLEPPAYALYKADCGIRVLSLFTLAKSIYSKQVAQCWQPVNDGEVSEGLISQPLLLPVMVNLTKDQHQLAVTEQDMLTKAGIVYVLHDKYKLQIRQFPALLREQDVNSAFIKVIDELISIQKNNATNQFKGFTLIDYCNAIGIAMVLPQYDAIQADLLLKEAKKLFNEKLSQQLLLNSIPLDLTSHIKQLH